MLASKPWDDPDNFLDFWIMDKFNVLPNDKRFLSLFEEQKLAIYEGLSIVPNQDDLRRKIRITHAIERIKEKDDQNVVSKGMIKRMKESFEAQGLESIRVKEELKKYIEKIRATEIANLEKELHG